MPSSFSKIIIEKGIFFSMVINQVVNQFYHGKFIPPKGYQVIKLIGTKKYPSLGCILESKKDLLIAFRGSEDINDFLEDMMFAPVKFPYLKQQAHVPQGFLSVYDSIRLIIFGTLRQLTMNKLLYITGHSLGGAVARFCALDLAVNTDFTHPGVLTLAAPRTGDLNFVSYYNQMIQRNVGIFNKHDPVPFLPPQYRQVKNEFPISFRYKNPIKNHLIKNYYYELCHLSPLECKRLCQLNPLYCLEQS